MAPKKSSETVQKPTPQSNPAPAKSASSDTKDTGSSFEMDVGMKWFARIGILALVIGLGLFIKYAIDNNWITYIWRIILGVLLGVAMIVSGHIVAKRESYFAWGMTLAAGGFAVTYFSVYAAYYFEAYRSLIGITEIMDILLLSIVIVSAIFFSIKNDSQIFAAGSFILGYVTSMLAGYSNPICLLYCSLLTFGLLAVMVYKRWLPIGVGGIVATYVIYIIWYVSAWDSQNELLLGSIFLIGWFIIFIVHTFLLDEKGNKNIEGYNIGVTITNMVFFFILYMFIIARYFEYFDTGFTFIIALFCFVMYAISSFVSRRGLSLVYLYSGISFLTLAFSMWADAQWITVLWVAETVILSVLYFQADVKGLDIAAYVVGGITVIKVLFFDSWNKSSDALAILGSQRVLPFAIAAISFYFIAWYTWDKRSKEKYFASEVFLWFATGLAFLLMLLETKGNVWTSVLFAVLGMVILMLGFMIDNSQFRLQGIIILGITVLKVFLYDTRNLEMIYKTLSFIVLGVLLLVASFIYTRYKDRIKEII